MDERDLDPDPLRQFERWFAETREAGVEAPETMALATSTPDGRPSARMVLLKCADERGFGFHTNYESRKGGELEANPKAALLFYWQPLGRQVRVEGAVERAAAEESEAYFRTRPPGSRYAAWASPQSRPLADRAELEQLFEETVERFGADVPLPPHWGGLRLEPDAYEFWQHGEDRLHDRFRYERARSGWARTRLAP
ncbi:MAG: pyridoxamine 5'-phosphate oxidase [Actinomycetota bacterium]|nr:pyridoxamine 5'-phosphate oxidase [Actinomycetota bacterium]